MKVSDVLTRLSRGHLSNLSISNEGSGDIIETQIPRVISYLNSSLEKLHSRFVLLEKELIIEMQLGRTNYGIHSKNGQAYKTANPTSTYPVYILDEASPYTDDLIRILQVYNSAGVRLALNDGANPEALFTPRMDLLQVPSSAKYTMLSVLYQARHPLIADTDVDAEVNLPLALEQALLSDIAAQVFSHMNSQEATMKAAEHSGNYEMQCALVVENDLANNSVSSSNVRFVSGGWV